MRRHSKMLTVIIMATIGFGAHQAFAEGEYGEHYDAHFGPEWRWTAVHKGNPTLLAEVDYPCHLKAYGWKLLATERRAPIKSRATLFTNILGEVWQKWAWRMVLYNPGDASIRAAVRAELKSNEDFIIDSNEKYFGDGLDPILLKPKESQVIQETSSYNTAERKGEGEPSWMDPRMSCVKAE